MLQSRENLKNNCIFRTKSRNLCSLIKWNWDLTAIGWHLVNQWSLTFLKTFCSLLLCSLIVLTVHSFMKISLTLPVPPWAPRSCRSTKSTSPSWLWMQCYGLRVREIFQLSKSSRKLEAHWKILFSMKVRIKKELGIFYHYGLYYDFYVLSHSCYWHWKTDQFKFILCIESEEHIICILFQKFGIWRDTSVGNSCSVK